MSYLSKTPWTSWRTAVSETTSALVAVVAADLLLNIVFSPYYILGFVCAATIGILPIVVLALRKKKVLLDLYKKAVTRFGVWLSIILVGNIFTSAWAVFKISVTSGPLFAGPLAIGLFFLLVLLVNRIINLLPSLGAKTPARVLTSSNA